MDSTSQNPRSPAPVEPVIPPQRAQEPRVTWVVDLRSHRIVRRDDVKRPRPGGRAL